MRREETRVTVIKLKEQIIELKELLVLFHTLNNE